MVGISNHFNISRLFNLIFKIKKLNSVLVYEILYWPTAALILSLNLIQYSVLNEDLGAKHFKIL